ncbi:exodeoxyribonuclease I [Geothrix sp. 21YS21S-2]|uniref:exodeoxyribonuclease I n=1 Tax=Geothrix sp. 21YS21S-2 TaxID=3068893 RepID=UPI0027B97FB7|nr:exodeoxyribonuclease I [Geothrix sp. 21YS21S-2]
MDPTFYWHDYETFGVDPRADRPAQFAGLRTDLDLREVGEPLEIWCRLSPDYLPQPEACLLTGIGPGAVGRLGLREADFITAIHTEMARPGTCTVGYNSLRFDDEVTRSTLFRNLLDPYAREWKNGNSRWDLLDVLRLARAFRPEGIVWPDQEDGTPSFRLGDLTRANGIPHGEAHTALADVRATLALARRLKAAQPRLWDFALKARGKQWVRAQADPAHPQALIHVSGMFKAAQGSFSLVWPVGDQPDRPNEIVLWDLRVPFEPFLDLDVPALRERMFAKAEDLASRGWERPGVKTLHTNKCPVIVRDLRLLTPAVAERHGLDLPGLEARGAALQAQTAFRARLVEASGSAFAGPGSADPDFSIYGGFFSDADRAWMDRIHLSAPAELGRLRPVFKDPRLPELFFRYRARNWPELLTPAEAERWAAHCRNRLEHPPLESLLGLDRFREVLAGFRKSHPERTALWQELEDCLPAEVPSER